MDDHINSIFATPLHDSIELDSNSTNPVPTTYFEHVVASPLPDYDAEFEPLYTGPMPKSSCTVGPVQDATYPTADHSDFTHPMLKLYMQQKNQKFKISKFGKKWPSLIRYKYF